MFRRRTDWASADPNVAEACVEEGSMDAIKLLKDDHDRVKKILEQLDSTTERGVKTREELFAKVKQELTVHEAIEEEIFYPALKDHPKAKELVLEAYEEHHIVDTVIAEITQVPYDDERWGAKLTVMKENVEHHIEEEEDQMFKQARQVFGSDELEELGSRMQSRKDELLSSPM
jgi:hemerythrin-like domain-containing protein